MHKVTKGAAAIALAVAGFSTTAAMGQQAQTRPPDGFFAWEVNAPGQSPDFTASPFLNNGNAAQVEAQFAAARLANPNAVLAVKVAEPLTNPDAVDIFRKFPVKYVFANFEDAARVGRTRALADQVIASGTSSNAYVGNFNIYPNASNDPTRPGVVSTVAQSFSNRPFSADYIDQRGRIGNTFGRQMSNEGLYPGAPDYRNPAAGNSNAPNIRSALFTLPIQRFTLAEAGLRGLGNVPSGAAGFSQAGRQNATNNLHIPWVSRFNNFGNAALDTDGNSANGFAFVQNAANPANGQLLSRGDFAAMILHYRMRGAHSVNVFSSDTGGVVAGYSAEQERSDVRAGWANSGTANQIFGRGNFAFSNLTNTVGDMNANSGDVNPRSTEVAGVVWSGVYDRAGTVDSTGRRRMMILLSNLGNASKIVDLPNNIGGFSVFKPPGSTSLDRFDDFTINAGQHRLLNFALQQSSRGRTEWVFQSDTIGQGIFADVNRNGVGVPEPTSLALVGIAAVGLLARRRRAHT